MQYSLKGVIRRYGHMQFFGGRGSIIQTLFGVENLSASGKSLLDPPGSVYDRLRLLAQDGAEFDVSECIYAWTAAWRQHWTHILVGIQLEPDDDVDPVALVNQKTVWKEGIETRWSMRSGKGATPHTWACTRPGELPCTVTFEVSWDPVGTYMHTVVVSTGSGQANAGRWFISDPASTVAHEFGHLLGNPDEYADSDCPNRNPVNTDTIMDNPSTGDIPARLMTGFADLIGSNIAAG